MNKLPNFTASLLHKEAYGLDIGGEVREDKQLNTKDLRFRPETPPNPQQFTTAPSGKTLDPGAVLYSGTTKRLWDSDSDEPLTLFTDAAQARLYANNLTESSVYRDPGLTPQSADHPIVLCVKFEALDGLELLPDPNSAASSWQASLERDGSFQAAGPISQIKAKFKLV